MQTAQAVTRESLLDSIVDAYGGDPRAALAAVLADNERLCRYVDKAVSAGYSRGEKFEVARLIAWA